MNGNPTEYIVVIVLDPAFGERILEVGRRNDIWIAPSDVNREAADRLWKLVEHEAEKPLVSVWSTPRTGATETEWFGILQTSRCTTASTLMTRSLRNCAL